MGYTRYWTRTDKPITQSFVDTVNKIIEDCRSKGITIRNGYGEDEPIVTLNLISINGTHENDLSHETFFMSNDGDGWNFCKTARKPYDYAVREIIKAAEKEKLITDVASDGENNEIISDKDYLGE
jgi:hypothetical protein